MKLVQKLLVKGVKYKVFVGETPCGIEGLCYKFEKKIVISDLVEKERVGYVLTHELAHAYMHECYVDQTLDRTQEEIMCEITATIVRDFSSFFIELRKKLK